MDLATVLPTFSLHPYPNLFPSLERNHITTTDLVTLDVVELAKRARLPLLPLKNLCDHVLRALQADYQIDNIVGDGDDKLVLSMRSNGRNLLQKWNTISTLDAQLDAALGGGIPTGYITEITGESGVGKTQLLLTLLLSTQLPPPHGLSRPSLYISTESPLSTNRLSQILKTHPLLASHSCPPTLDKVLSIITADLETQEHILQYQVPVAIEKFGIGCIILDSVAGNYRAEFDGKGGERHGANMAKRTAALIKLGALLRHYAQTHNLAIIVANQVSDRFTPLPTLQNTQLPPSSYASSHPLPSQPSPLAHRSTHPQSHHYHNNLSSQHPLSSPHPPTPSSTQTQILTPNLLKIDHQQRFFTGWGDDLPLSSHPSFRLIPQKTPALGLVWTEQIAARIALLKSPVYGARAYASPLEFGVGQGEGGDERAADGEGMEGREGREASEKWKRYFKVVFTGWVAASGVGVEGAVEFEIWKGGVRSLGEGRMEGEDGGL